jgi:predicted N-acetyltransferase YhbS
MSAKVINRPVAPPDLPRISALHAEVFGPGRFARSAYRVREGKAADLSPISPFCRLALMGDRLVAALRLTEVTIGGKAGALLLGPLAVAPDVAGQGFGRALVAEALEAAKGAGVRLVVLVGDQSYYGRFGFKPAPSGQIALPGPVNPARLLVTELVPGALADYRGLVTTA